MGDERNSAGGCAVRELSRARLVVEERRELYVEPVALAANPRGDALLAGRPNYLWKRSRSGEAKLVGRDSVFGAVIAADGTARTIRSPVPAWLLGTVRVLGRKDGGWDVVFAELRPYARSTEHPPYTDSVAHLWHGVYDGRRWTSLEEIPPPPQVQLSSGGASALVRWGDTLAWAVRTRAKPPGYSIDVAVFERRNRRWSHEIVPTRSTAYVALAHSASGPVLAIVAPDETERQDRNSLFLWVRQPTWKSLRKVVSGTREGPVHHPSLIASDDQLVLTWAASRDRAAQPELRAIIGALRGPPDRVFVIDSSSFRAGAYLGLPGGPHMWIANHNLSEHAREVRFVRIAGQEAVPAGSAPSPFLGGFGASTIGTSEILLAGAVWDDTEQMPVSLIVRMGVSCPTQGSRAENRSLPKGMHPFLQQQGR
jgi:hypothetical protein